MRKLVMASSAVAALLPAIVSGHANAASGPFANMAGSWTGGGTLTMSSGQSERLRCRASYGVAEDGRNLRLNLRCASDSYDFNLAGDVQYERGAIAGSWSESSRNAAGTISGRVDGNRIEAVARGNNFSASLALTTAPGRQAVVIQPQGTDVRTVAVRLNRR
jgi:hypothetical protein